VKERFVLWWRAPARRRDRIVAAWIGALGCFWIAVLGRMLFGPLPVSLEVIAWWGLGSAAAGATLGCTFPKATTCICFPFSLFGVGQ